MLYSGKSITLERLDNGIVELCFNDQSAFFNKLDTHTLTDLRQVGEVLISDSAITGLLVTSAKTSFILGADITEFHESFSKSENVIIEGMLANHDIFNAIEDLPFPTVTAINGMALGGGLEMALSTDYRVISTKTQIGMPEVKLGIYPGFGGTVRLSRIIGADNAIEWIAGGKEYKAKAAFAVGVADAMVAPDKLKYSALKMLNQCIDGQLDYRKKRATKLEPLQLNMLARTMVFETAKAFVFGQSGPNYPAPLAAVNTMQSHATVSRNEAQLIEAKGFVKLVKTSVSENLINLFLGDQQLTKTAKYWASKVESIEKGAVIGAGIMGGGIAYQSASKNIPILMKDIDQQGLDLGLKEASQMLAKKVSRGRLRPEQMANVLNQITPTLDYSAFDKVDIAIEAVLENTKIKQTVLAEAENYLPEQAILCSNTSTISIDVLAESLKRPENFCGMHFFNPVHKMPLVEVIRGAKTSEATIARTVNYALAMGKKPVVVRDCPGFLVNRILSPYLGAFMALVREGADFAVIDKVMEKFGMPMGPAYLCDVVGLDTGAHAGFVMAKGFDRMSRNFQTAGELLFGRGRLGQKNGQGFYQYNTDKKGRLKKTIDHDVKGLLAKHQISTKDFSKQEISERLMIPLCLEAVRCLEDNIADTANEVDMSLIYGIGFPAFRGGALRYIESIGLAEFVALADSYSTHGALYHPTEKLRAMAASGESFFS